MLCCVRALFPFTQSFLLGFQGGKVAKMTLLKLLNSSVLIWHESTMFRQQQRASACKGGKKVLPQLDFCHFLDIFQDTWQTLKWGVAPLFIETSLTPASHGSQWKNRALTLQNGEYLLLINLWLCVPTEPLYSIISFFFFSLHWFISCSTGTVEFNILTVCVKYS